jgi:hypothetical protein
VDEITRLFLGAQRRDALQLAAESPFLDVDVLDDQHMVAHYSCKGLIRSPSGSIEQHDRFAVALFFSESYLRAAKPEEVLTWLEPLSIWHPNISPPWICVGPIARGTRAVDLLYRCFELVTWQNATIGEVDTLNPAAGAWARRHLERIPVDVRPLKGRSRSPELEASLRALQEAR